MPTRPNILILGLGQFAKGSGISAALFFARQKTNVRVTDQKTEQDLASNVARLKRFKNVKFILGKHRLEDIRWADIIVRNPRVRPSSPEMRLATRLGKRVESDVSLFMARCPCPIVGITGTRGKSTTTALVGEMLKRSGKRVWIGGNILVSPLTFLNKVRKGDIVVLELSSWLLETTGNLGLSPHVAVVTNIMRDHLNSYEGMDDYVEAKAQIFRHQRPDDIVILNADDENCRRFAEEAPSRVLTFSSKYRDADAMLTVRDMNWKDPKTGTRGILLKRKDVKILGEHNALNVLAASLTARVAGATVSGIRSATKDFTGLENRLETIATIRGVRYVNDTTATTPDAVIAAIKSLAPVSKRIHLIAGGTDKELEFEDVASVIKRFPVTVSLFEGSAIKKFSDALNRVGVPFVRVPDMKSALEFHMRDAKKGDTILLSPGCTSFGMFKNEFDRGEQFKALVRRLK